MCEMVKFVVGFDDDMPLVVVVMQALLCLGYGSGVPLSVG